MSIPLELWEMRFALLGMQNALRGPANGSGTFSRFAIHLFEQAEKLGLHKSPTPARRRGQKLAISAARWMMQSDVVAEELTTAIARELRLLDAVIDRCMHQTRCMHPPCANGGTVHEKRPFHSAVPRSVPVETTEWAEMANPSSFPA